MTQPKHRNLLAEEMQLLMELPIQFFAGDGDTPPADPPATPPADPGTDPTPPADPPATPPAPTGTFTQEEVNAFVARETKKSQEKMFKQLGITDFNSAKEGMAKFTEWQKSQMTEQERIANENTTLQTNYQNVVSEKEALEAKFIAVQSGIATDSIDDVVTLAKTMVSEDVTIDDAIKKVAEKYPNFLADKPAPPADPDPTPKPKFSTGQHGGGATLTDAEAWQLAFNPQK